MLALLEAGADVNAEMMPNPRRGDDGQWVEAGGDVPGETAIGLALEADWHRDHEAAVGALLAAGAARRLSSCARAAAIHRRPLCVPIGAQDATDLQFVLHPRSPPTGAALPPGATLPRAACEVAAALCLVREQALSDAAVDFARQRVHSALDASVSDAAASSSSSNNTGGEARSNHALARALRAGSTGRRRLVHDITFAAEPNAQRAAEWVLEQRKRAAEALAQPAATAPGAAAGPLITPPDGDALRGLLYPGREAALLAVAERAAEAARLAASDAAVRSVAALAQAMELASPPAAVGDDGGSALCAERNATAYEKALYAAARCAGRWWELRSLEAEAAIEVAAAMERLDVARAAAAEVQAHIARLQREQAQLGGRMQNGAPGA